MANKRRRLVLCNATPGTDAEFNKWYNEVHAKELIALNGYKSLTRFQVDLQLQPQAAQPEYAYLSVWDFTDIDAANAASAARQNLTMSPSLDLARTVMCELEEIFTYKK